MILDEILHRKRLEVLSMRGFDRQRLQRVHQARPPRDFTAALRRNGTSIIAEIKAKSPTVRSFERANDPVCLGENYERYGARALSVVVDAKDFGGSPGIVDRVANAPTITLPVLYKDFVVDERQIYEARANGADAVLLIARAVRGETLSQFVDLAHRLGMAALVEAGDEDDILTALMTGTLLIGVNNRDLATQQIDLENSIRLAPLIPEHITRISESGISSRNNIRDVEKAGYDAVLIGESLLTAPQLDEFMASLLVRDTKGSS